MEAARRVYKHSTWTRLFSVYPSIPPIVSFILKIGSIVIHGPGTSSEIIVVEPARAHIEAQASAPIVYGSSIMAGMRCGYR
jgi:hypothetical protein